VGKFADLVAVELNSVETKPFYYVVSLLVYATGRDKVSDVWVAGKQLLKQRQLTTLNETKIIADARQWAHKIQQAEQ
jgi:5-methylthioadenosine/S-adenosylhomocysteine deaminase